MTDQVAPSGHLRHLIDLGGLDRPQMERILERARSYMVEPGKPPPRDPVLRGRTVANLFYEASTRTRASFELAAKRLDADVLNLDVNMSSRTKGESILDTIFTLQAMHIDFFVVRDASSGVPSMIAEAVEPHVCVLNAGEADSSHPTQGLLDLLTIQEHRGDVANLCVAIIGDIRHSRVARSAAQALNAFGVGELRIIGPEELLPGTGDFPPAVQMTDLDAGLREADVVMALRIQKERFTTLQNVPDALEYFSRYGLTEERLEQTAPGAIIMHPGPMNRGIEIATEVADGPRSVIREQVSNGLAVRMGVLSVVNEYVRHSRGEPAA